MIPEGQQNRSRDLLKRKKIRGEDKSDLEHIQYTKILISVWTKKYKN